MNVGPIAVVHAVVRPKLKEIDRTRLSDINEGLLMVAKMQR